MEWCERDIRKMETARYTYSPTHVFSKKLDRERASNPPGYKRIVQVIERLVQHPDDADGKMHGVYNGRFKKYVGRSEYRLIYYYCEICRKENHRLEQKCSKCDEVPDNSVIFFDLYHKSELKKFKKNG